MFASNVRAAKCSLSPPVEIKPEENKSSANCLSSRFAAFSEGAKTAWRFSSVKNF
jgi:hypothetical protein